MRFLGDTPKEFDVCIDVTYPEAKKPDGGTAGGLAIWFKDYQNTYIVATTPAGVAGAHRYNKDKYGLVSPYRKQASLKAGVGEKNTLRVTAKGNQVTVYANDQRLFAFRGTPEEAYIGLYAQSWEGETSNTWKFSNFKLTEAPK